MNILRLKMNTGKTKQKTHLQQLLIAVQHS